MIDGGVYVSWNGATDVWEWQLEASDQPQREKPTFTMLEKTRKIGFETRISAPIVNQYMEFRVVALDAHGVVLGVTETMKIEAMLQGNSSNLRILLTVALISCAFLAVWYFWKRYGPHRTWPWRYQEYHTVPSNKSS